MSWPATIYGYHRIPFLISELPERSRRQNSHPAGGASQGIQRTRLLVVLLCYIGFEVKFSLTMLIVNPILCSLVSMPLKLKEFLQKAALCVFCIESWTNNSARAEPRPCKMEITSLGWKFSSDIVGIPCFLWLLISAAGTIYAEATL